MVSGEGSERTKRDRTVSWMLDELGTRSLRTLGHKTISSLGLCQYTREKEDFRKDPRTRAAPSLKKTHIISVRVFSLSYFCKKQIIHINILKLHFLKKRKMLLKMRSGAWRSLRGRRIRQEPTDVLSSQFISLPPLAHLITIYRLRSTNSNCAKFHSTFIWNRKKKNIEKKYFNNPQPDNPGNVKLFKSYPRRFFVYCSRVLWYQRRSLMATIEPC